MGGLEQPRRPGGHGKTRWMGPLAKRLALGIALAIPVAALWVGALVLLVLFVRTGARPGRPLMVLLAVPVAATACAWFVYRDRFPGRPPARLDGQVWRGIVERVRARWPGELRGGAESTYYAELSDLSTDRVAYAVSQLVDDPRASFPTPVELRRRAKAIPDDRALPSAKTFLHTPGSASEQTGQERREGRGVLPAAGATWIAGNARSRRDRDGTDDSDSDGLDWSNLFDA